MRLQSPILIAGGLALMSLFSAGCTAPEILNLGGRTALATGALYRQAESIVMARDREAAPQCKTRSVLGTRLLEAPEAIADPRGRGESVSFSGSGTPSSYVIPSERRYSRFVERWVVQRCDAEVVYRVIFTPSASGSDISAELETTPPSP
ncbi:MAG: hypothetical protein EXS21_11120 [Pedosphaera sp.]|jgi:hypothetical protein|nr:hypothetical protein [Pedosphaera sp.]